MHVKVDLFADNTETVIFIFKSILEVKDTIVKIW